MVELVRGGGVVGLEVMVVRCCGGCSREQRERERERRKGKKRCRVQ